MFVRKGRRQDWQRYFKDIKNNAAQQDSASDRELARWMLF